MSDIFFLKQLHGNYWLGLRLPEGLRLDFDGAQGLDVSSSWQYSATKWPAKLIEVHTPILEYVAAGDPAIDLKWRKLTVTVPEDLAPEPFAAIEAEIGQWPAEAKRAVVRATSEEEATKALADMFLELRKSPSVPLRMLQAYRDFYMAGFKVQKTEEKTIEAAQARMQSLLGKETSLPIELLSGLLFIAKTESAKIPTGANASVDPLPMDAPKKSLALSAIQLRDRVAFELLVDGVPLTNGSVSSRIADENAAREAIARLNGAEDVGVGKAVADAKLLVPYYRLTRTLGIEENPSMMTGLIVIPIDAPTPATKPTAGEQNAEAEFKGKKWGERIFRPFDPIGKSLAGQLLNYRIELFNAHGRCTHQGRLMFARQSMERPAAPLRGVARILVNESGEPLKLRIGLALPESELIKSDKSELASDVMVYKLDSPLVPTGFYGDADDAALAVGRLMSDIDPGAVLASGGAELPADQDDELPIDPKLGSYGLHLMEPATGLSEPVHEKNLVTAAAKPDDASGKADAQLEWWLTLANPSSQIEQQRGLRLFVALRRRLDPSMLQANQKAPESPLVALALEIAVSSSDDAAVTAASVQHFERFWDKPDALSLAPLGDGDAVVAEIPKPANPADDAEPEPAELRVVIDHGKLVGKDPMSVGGYRIWMRDIDRPDMAWRMQAVVQAVPPLVKAYAPIETGRIWSAPKPDDEKPIEGAALLSVPDFLLANGERVKRPEGALDNDDISEELVKTMTANGAALLAAMRGLALKGKAVEVVLSVAVRRRLERGDYPPAKVLPEGNWVLLKDQNGHYLGRAWNFWGVPADGPLKRRYELIEQPNAQDTVGMDDFGRISWNWRGLKDGWRHELEWVIEPLARHAPLLQRIATTLHEDREIVDRYLRPDVSGPRLRPVDTPPLTPPPEDPLPDFERSVKHRIVVQRRKPLDKMRFGVVQRIDSPEDKFIFRVIAPPPFQQATYNTLLRTSQGVLAMRVETTQREFRWKSYFDTANAEMNTLFRSWCTTSVADEKAGDLSAIVKKQKEPLSGDFGELVIDEPSCFSIGFRLHLSADDMVGGYTEVSGVSRRADKLPPAQDFEEHQRLFGDRPKLVEGRTLLIPLARMDWSYNGASLPQMSLVFAGTLVSKKSLLRLPDPLAEATVFVRAAGNKPFRPVARFLAEYLKQRNSADAATEQYPMKPSNEVAWGMLSASAGIDASLKAENGPEGGRIKLFFDETFEGDLQPENIRIQWRREGSQTSLQPKPQ